MSFISLQSHYNAGQDALSLNLDPTYQIAVSQDLTKRESAENYAHVLCQISPQLRIISCKDNWQWIIQERDRSGLRWRAVWYCRTKLGLERKLSNYGVSLPEYWPQWFVRGNA